MLSGVYVICVCRDTRMVALILGLCKTQHIGNTVCKNIFLLQFYIAQEEFLCRILYTILSYELNTATNSAKNNIQAKYNI